MRPCNVRLEVERLSPHCCTELCIQNINILVIYWVKNLKHFPLSFVSPKCVFSWRKCLFFTPLKTEQRLDTWCHWQITVMMSITCHHGALPYSLIILSNVTWRFCVSVFFSRLAISQTTTITMELIPIRCASFSIFASFKKNFKIFLFKDAFELYLWTCIVILLSCIYLFPLWLLYLQSALSVIKLMDTGAIQVYIIIIILLLLLLLR